MGFFAKWAEAALGSTRSLTLSANAPNFTRCHFERSNSGSFAPSGLTAMFCNLLILFIFLFIAVCGPGR